MTTIPIPDFLITKPVLPAPPSPAQLRADEVAATEAYALLFPPARPRPSCR